MVLKGETYDYFGTVGGSSLGIFEFSTIQTKIHMKGVGGEKMMLGTKMQMVLKGTWVKCEWGVRF